MKHEVEKKARRTVRAGLVGLGTVGTGTIRDLRRTSRRFSVGSTAGSKSRPSVPSA